MTEINDYNNQQFYIPSNVEQFLYDYKNSKFLECNFEMADEINKSKYHQIKSKNILVSSKLTEIKSFMESRRLNYVLAAGTLLGWYRNCGVIPYTTDADIILFEFDSKIEEYFNNNKKVSLMIKFGFDNDSLEFRIGSENFHIDLFFSYEYNVTHQWFPYHNGREVLRTIASKFDSLCSVELLDEKYYAPCDPVKYLDEKYGHDGWQKNVENFNNNYNVNKFKIWNDLEWPRAIQLYKN